MFRALFYIFLIYLAYQFIFNFVIPVYRTTQQVRKGFRNMQDQMNAHDPANNQGGAGQPTQKQSPNKATAGEYIDFEEVK